MHRIVCLPAKVKYPLSLYICPLFTLYYSYPLFPLATTMLLSVSMIFCCLIVLFVYLLLSILCFTYERSIGFIFKKWLDLFLSYQEVFIPLTSEINETLFFHNVWSSFSSSEDFQGGHILRNNTIQCFANFLKVQPVVRKSLVVLWFDPQFEKYDCTIIA